MKPRVFLSSTFYDLKYIRGDLSHFIEDHGFDTILFENGDIGYTSGVALDESCYEAMRNSDMVILVIGAQYGSPATGEDNFGEYVSVTRKEFRAAIANSIPIYCFLDRTVSAEYNIYKKNKKRIEMDDECIQFDAVKNINVFRFIDEIYGIGNIAVTAFEKSDDIKDFLDKQWADMFKKYLNSLREEKSTQLLTSSVAEMESILKQMKMMVDKIGEDTIKERIDYNNIIDEQNKIIVSDVANRIRNCIDIELSEEDFYKKEDNVKKLIKGLQLYLGNKGLFDESNDILHFIECKRSRIKYEIYNDIVHETVSNENLSNKLKETLLEDAYYYKIFAKDIYDIAPDWEIKPNGKLSANQVKRLLAKKEIEKFKNSKAEEEKNNNRGDAN